MTLPATSALEVRTATDRPPIVDVDPATGADWLAAHRDELRSAAVAHGAVLVRGLGAADGTTSASRLRALARDLLGDEEAFAQRRELDGRIYTSAAWPDHQQMCMHHELSYRSLVPGLVILSCVRAPDSGGVTGLADAAAVLDALPDELVRPFAERGWMLLRSYGGDIGPSVADAFGTEDRAAVEAYCRANGIEAAWQPDGTLATRQRRAAVITHPVTGARCWFNQVAFLSEWTIDPEIREFMIDMYGREGLPFTTAYGDGRPVEADVIATINATYEALTVREPWQAGDLMIIDNLATAHSREPFTGEREIQVALSDPTPAFEVGR